LELSCKLGLGNLKKIKINQKNIKKIDRKLRLTRYGRFMLELSSFTVAAHGQLAHGSKNIIGWNEKI
jgi:hypothetical protein